MQFYDILFTILCAMVIASLVIEAIFSSKRSSDDESLDDLHQESRRSPFLHDEQQDKLDSNQKD